MEARTFDVATLLERVVLPVVRALVGDDEAVDEIALRTEPDGNCC